jgi:putative endonuclease
LEKVAECTIMAVYHTYILCSATGVLYTGVTNNLEIRVIQHKRKLVNGFTKRYDVNRLVWFEAFGDIRNAIAREKQIKGWLRAKKIALIRVGNPAFCDLSEGFHR